MAILKDNPAYESVSPVSNTAESLTIFASMTASQNASKPNKPR